MENNIVEQESDLPFTQVDREVVSMLENITVGEKKTIAVSSAKKKRNIKLPIYANVIVGPKERLLALEKYALLKKNMEVFLLKKVLRSTLRKTQMHHILLT